MSAPVAGQVGPSSRSARRSRTLLLAGAAALATVDLILKAVTSARLTDGTTVDLGPLTLQLHHNTGVAFSLGAALPSWVIIAATGAIIAGLIYLLTALELLSIARSRSRRSPAPAAAAEQTAPFDWSALAWTVGGFVLFILTLRLLGWVLAAALLFCFVARGFGNRSPLTSLAVGLTVSSLAYIGFDMGLGLNLPSGILGGAF